MFDLNISSPSSYGAVILKAIVNTTHDRKFFLLSDSVSCRPHR